MRITFNLKQENDTCNGQLDQPITEGEVLKVINKGTQDW